jgi:hypothetical protein
MTTHEFAQFILHARTQSLAGPMDESAVKDVAQLISGSLIYHLYESLITNDYDPDEVTKHLETLCDTGNHFGVLYLVFILTDAVNESLPDQFVELTANHTTAPYLASALTEDWLDFHHDYGT